MLYGQRNEGDFHFLPFCLNTDIEYVIFLDLKIFLRTKRYVVILRKLINAHQCGKLPVKHVVSTVFLGKSTRRIGLNIQVIMQ